MTMEKHGILDFVYLKENDLPVPFDNSERREPSIWQILDHFGKRSVVVNWFVTYPPDKIDGIMVSNRFRRALLLGPERRRRMRDSVHPPQLFDRLLPFLDLDYEAVRRERELPDLGEAYPETPCERVSRRRSRVEASSRRRLARTPISSFSPITGSHCTPGATTTITFRRASLRLPASSRCAGRSRDRGERTR